MASITGIHIQNFSNGTDELIANWLNAPMIRDMDSDSTWTKAPIHLTESEAIFASFLDGMFMVNGTDDNRFYDGSSWYSQSTNTADSPIATFIKVYNSQIYLYGIKINGTNYFSRCWYSDFPKNNTITWGLETGSDLAQTASSAVITSVGSLFITRNIKVGDPILITSGANAGEYVVQSIDSETQLTLTTNLTNTATGSSFWVGGNWFDVSTDDGDMRAGLATGFDQLVLYKRNSVHRFNARGQELRQIKNMPGTTSPRSIVQGSDGYIYHYHPSGIWRTAGVDGQIVSNAIEDVIEGVTDANQTLVVGWEDDRKKINMYLGNVTLKDGETITNCVVQFNETSNIWNLKSFDHVIKCAVSGLISGVQRVFAGDNADSVFELNTGTDFDGQDIKTQIVLHPVFPGDSEALVNFTRLRAYIDNGPDVQIFYKLLYRPMRGDKQWDIEDNWSALKGSQLTNRTEWEFPNDARASGVQLKIVESGANESFTLSKLVLYYSNPSNY